MSTQPSIPSISNIDNVMKIGNVITDAYNTAKNDVAMASILILLLVIFIQIVYVWIIFSDKVAGIEAFSGKHNAESGNWLCDYYFKTAHNACASNNIVHTPISTTTLQSVISKGYRCLDFEIFSLKGVPVVATSSSKDPNTFESLNVIPFASCIKTINSHAFNSGTVNGDANSPLFINIRLKTQHSNIVDKIATLVSKIKNRYGGHYTDTKDISKRDIGNFYGKAVIMVDGNGGTGALVKSSDLNDLVHIMYGTTYNHALYMDEINRSSDAFKIQTQTNLTMVYPVLSSTAENSDPEIGFNSGVQFVSIKDGVVDAYHDFYTKEFTVKSVGRNGNMILKPTNLRHKEEDTILPPDPNIERRRIELENADKELGKLSDGFIKR